MAIELQQFVQQTLIDVLHGVRNASHDPAFGKLVAPSAVDGNVRGLEGSGVFVSLAGAGTVVKFDVAVTAETSDALKGGGAVKVAVLQLSASVGAGAETGSKDTAVTRIQFAVPILLPRGDDGTATTKV
jgi:hypothetical protein